MRTRFEYRVRWQREDHPPKRRIYQTRKGAENFLATLDGDLAATLGKNPDAFVCCDSIPCVCEYRGSQGTNFEAWIKEHARYPPFVAEPTVECREVGEWTPPQGENDE